MRVLNTPPAWRYASASASDMVVDPSRSVNTNVTSGRVLNSFLTASVQGLTLVHLSAQRKRFSWDKGY